VLGADCCLTREQALAALETITDLTTDLQDSPEPIRIDLNGFGKSEQADFDQEDSSDATSVTDDDALEALVLSKKSSSGSKDTGAIPDVESTVARKSRTLSGDLPVARVKDERGNPATRNLYVYGYGPGTCKAQLKKLFSNFVTIIDIFVMKEGYSFVNTTNRKEAILARQQLTGTALNGGDIRINFAKD
jgi:RNA recognition motif-containing protein